MTPFHVDMSMANLKPDKFVKDISVYLCKNQQNEGTVILEGTSIGIKYNTMSGALHLVDVDKEKQSSVKNFYSRDAFRPVLKLLTAALSLYAQYQLLLYLNTLGDKKISEIIKETQNSFR